MKDFDANKGIWGVIVLVITILTFFIVVYQFTTGNTRLVISINLAQSTPASTNITPTPTATISSAPSTATVLNVTPTPTIEKKNTGATTPTISYDIWTWVGWVVFGLFALLGALGLSAPEDYTDERNWSREDDYPLWGGILGFLLVVLSAWISSFWLNHVDLGFWYSVGVEFATAFGVVIVVRGTAKKLHP